MKIVIAGAGEVGFHLARLLSSEKQDITLIDSNQEVLDYASTHVDIQPVLGDVASISVLERAEVRLADLFLAMTASETTNLVSSILAKKFGARQTIARVDNPEFLTDDQRQTFNELGVDKLFSPIQLASQEIQRLLNKSEFTDLFEFEDGQFNLIGLVIEKGSKMLQAKLSEGAELPRSDLSPIAILRGTDTILPKPGMHLRYNDHVYFLLRNDQLEEVLSLFGKKRKQVRKVMIIGGSDLGLRTAQLIEKQFEVSLVEPRKDYCKRLVECLHETLVIKGDPGNVELLQEEGLREMDAFIALTQNSETNIVSCLLAADNGIYRTIALVDNTHYTHISQNIGVATLINKKLIAANNIFRFVRKGQVEAITSLHGVEAEVIEFVIHKNNRMTRLPIKDLHLPKNALIGGVIRGKESVIPSPDFVLKLRDKVIVFAMPDDIAQIEKMFH